MDSILPEFDYLTGGSLDSEVTDPLIYDAWGTVRDELTDFLLAVDFATDMQMAFGREVDVESGKEHIIDILNGESLPGIRVLPAANMYPAVGAFDMVTDTVYLADSLLDGSSGVDDGVLVDVLLEEVGHFLDGLLHEEDSLGDEGELFGRLVSGEELREWEVLEFLDEDDWVEILDGDVAVEVEASQEVDFEEVGRFDVGNGILAVGDFNRDGFADLAVPNGSNKVSVSLGKGDGSFRKATNFDIGAKSGLVEVEDFNADGFTDLVVVNSTSGNASVLLGKGNGSFRKSTNFNVGSSSSFNVGSSSRLVAVEDFNADGFADLAVVNSTSDTVSDTVSVLLGKGNGSFDPATNFVDVGDVSLLEGAAGYFNGDGFADLAVVNTISDTVSVLLGKGDGSFRKPTNFDVENYPWSVAVADFNRDGSADIAVANLLGGSVSVLLGKGNGSFRRPTNFDVGSGPNSLAEGDFNRDGFADLAVVINSSENISVLLGKGNGSFLPAINFDVEDSPSLVVVEDFNRDGLPDLAVTNGEDDNISILINKTPITTTPKITISDTKTTESNTNKTANFTVTLDNPSNETVKVNYTTANQTA
ncbi:MAG: FG-GAP repeat domain-containing protein, partial [Crocosphaera sp.]